MSRISTNKSVKKEVPVLNSQENVYDGILDKKKTPEKPVWVSDMGGWNHMPKPFRYGKLEDALIEIINFSYQEEFRQVQDLYPKEVWNGLTSIKIFWFMGHGWAI